MSYICPHCQKELKHKKSLNSHIAKLHPDKVEPPSPSSPPSPPSPSPKTLEIVTPGKGGKEPEADYHCVDCGTPLTKGQTPCPNCGAELDWGAIENED